MLTKVSAIEYNKTMNPRIIKIAVLNNGSAPVADWLNSLDKINKARVQSRLTRLLENNFGDCKKIDSEISEIRLKFGSGYRIYYTEIDGVVVLLINAGNKATQSRDIKKAKSILKEWKNLQ